MASTIVDIVLRQKDDLTYNLTEIFHLVLSKLISSNWNLHNLFAFLPIEWDLQQVWESFPSFIPPSSELLLVRLKEIWR